MEEETRPRDRWLDSLTPAELQIYQATLVSGMLISIVATTVLVLNHGESLLTTVFMWAFWAAIGVQAAHVVAGLFVLIAQATAKLQLR